MAKIKGLWQFNEVIVPPTQEIDQDLTYTFPEPPDSDFSHGRGICFKMVGDGRVYFFYSNIAGGSVSSPVYYQDAWRKQGWRTIDFGSTEQEVSDEFYAQMTANATRMYDEEPETEELPGGTTITYDGGTIAAVVSGGIATLKCAGLKMKTDITVKAAEGGVNLPNYDGEVEIEGEEIPDEGKDSVAINGIIREYKVNAGANVSAGDFVEFVSKWSSDGVVDKTGKATKMSACKLGINSVFIVYKYGTSLRAVVCTIDGNTISVGEENTVHTHTDNSYNYISCAAVTDNKVFVAYQTNYYAAYGCVCSIEGTMITAGTRVTIGATSSYGSAGANVKVVALGENRVLAVCDQYSMSGTYICGYVYTIEGDVATSTAYNGKLTPNYYDEGRLVKLTENRVLMLCKRSGTIKGFVLTIDGNTLESGTEQDLVATGNITQTYSSATKLTDSKVFIAFQSKSSSVYYFRGVVCTINGPTITTGAIATLDTGGSNSDIFKFNSVETLTEDKVFVSYHTLESVCGVVCTVDGTDITVGTKTVLEEGKSISYGISLIAFSEGSVLSVNSGDLATCVGAIIDGTNITVNSSPEVIVGTYVQPATSSLHNVGVAKTGGAAGETVEVYCVGGTE